MGIESQNQYIGKKIKEFRLARKWTQEELGKKLDKKFNTISAYERGIIEIPTSTLHQLAQLFEISYTELLPLESEDLDETLQKAMYIANNSLNEDETEFLQKLIEKTLSLNKQEREDFLKNIRFAVEYFEKK